MWKLLISTVPLVLALAGSCANQRGAQRSAPVGEVEKRESTQRNLNNSEWTNSEVPFLKSGDVVALGSDGNVLIAGQGTLVLSSDGGQTWRTLRGGEGDNMYTTDGGVAFRDAHTDSDSRSSKINVNSLCSVESAAFALSARVYLSTMCDHSTALWSIPTAEDSGAWHVRGFAPSPEQHESSENGGYYTPGRNLVAVGERVLVDAILPGGTCLLTTDDNGATWRRLWCDSHAAPIVSIDFVDGQQGWMLHGDGKLDRTEDAGRNWVSISTLPAETAGHTFSLDFVNSTVGFVVGEGGLILSTKDGGRSWQREGSGTKNSLYRIAAGNEKRAWAVGEKGTVLETNDGGRIWRKAELGLDEDLRTLAVKNGTAWFVVGNHLYRSS